MSHIAVTTIQSSIDNIDDERSRVRIILESVSLGLLVCAGLLWSFVWYRASLGHPYRYVTFLVAIFFAIISHVFGLIELLVETPTDVACRSVVIITSFANLVLYTFIFLYTVFCVAVAMRRLSSGPRFYLIILIAVGMPLLVVGFETILDLIFHPGSQCEFFHLSTTYQWFTKAPKAILLLGAVCVSGILFYWIFCFDNEIFKRNRDFLVIRHSCVTVFLFVVYCFFAEIYELVYLNMQSGAVSNQTLVEYRDIMTLMESSRGIFAAFFLCFWDLEILSIVPGCPCIPDLRDTDIDDAWESRIRSESKVQFASGDESPAPIDDGSELRPQGKINYGTLVEEGEEEQG